MTPDTLAAILAEVRSARGVDFSAYRRTTLERRLGVAMARAGAADAAAYLALLRRDPAEAGRLADTIAVNVTGFFRDPLVFETLAEEVVPRLVEAARGRDGRGTLRAWCAGCASGEEAYSLAILLREAWGEDEPDKGRLLVFATDIDRAALAAARDASYARERLHEVRLGLLDRHFQAHGDRFRVGAHIRSLVHFSEDDLVSVNSTSPADSVFGHFDLILCRNVLIYLTQPGQERLLAKLAAALAPGGILVLGRAEGLVGPAAAACVELDRPCRIYRRRT